MMTTAVIVSGGQTTDSSAVNASKEALCASKRVRMPNAISW
jgi:hypothetical protein